MGEVFPTPLGIVSDISGKKVTVVVDGELKVTGRTLKVGKEYMANSRGELVEGDYVGEMNSDSYLRSGREGERERDPDHREPGGLCHF